MTLRMGQSESSLPSTGNNNTTSNDDEHNQQQHQRAQHPDADNIQQLMGYARNNYQENPTESLACLLQALKLNGGQESADLAMNRLRDELGDDIATHIGNSHKRMERAVNIIEELLADENTFLYQQGKSEFLRMSMEDGSSVVCSKCNDVVSSSRWQQHQQYWCRTIVQDEDDNGDDGMEEEENKPQIPMDMLL